MATYSEEILIRLLGIAQQNAISLFDAAVHWCESNQMDEAEFFSSLDEYAKNKIKSSAIDENYVRRCDVPRSKTFAHL